MSSLKFSIFISIILVSFPLGILQAQQDSEQDTLRTNTIAGVVIEAFSSRWQLLETPAAVAMLPKSLDTRGPELFVATVNSLPGVQLDERSPGSIRLNMRGSSMRAPFGVRNVKVYYNGLPFTEPGGTTYLNQLSFSKFEGAEFLKGPGGSHYGAGTGGVVLLNDLPGNSELLDFSAGYGTYNAHYADASTTVRLKDFKLKTSAYHDRSDGYRDHSATEKSLFTITGLGPLSANQQMTLTLLHGNLNYQTPGALTLSEYTADRRASRPRAGNFPSAVEANASIHQRLTMVGLQLKGNVGMQIQHETSVNGAFTRLINPAIRNYADSEIPHFGMRSVWSWHRNLSGSLKTALSAGVEGQWGRNEATVFANVNGSKGTLQQNSLIKTRPLLLFLQNTWQFGKLSFEGALAVHKNRMILNDFVNATDIQADAKTVLTPRFTVSMPFTNNYFIYALYSRGFSPPTSDELLPTGSAYNRELQSENGDNFEIGFRKMLSGNGLLEFNAYWFSLKNTIVQRRDAGGGDYYVNAGKTQQPGLEVSYTQQHRLGRFWSLQTGAS